MLASLEHCMGGQLLLYCAQELLLGVHIFSSFSIYIGADRFFCVFQLQLGAQYPLCFFSVS